MKKCWKIIGLTISVLIVGLIYYYVPQKYLRQENEVKDDFVFEDYKVDWKNENVELQIRNILEKYNEDIYLSDVYDISSLTLEGKGIDTLEDLSIFKRLISLTLKNTDVKDLRPLADLNCLSKISIIEGEQSVIDALTVLSALTRLEIHNSSDINNIRPVRELKNLTECYIYNCDVKDISALGELKKLEIVDISNCNIEDISALGELENLKGLGISNCNIEDISALVELKNLKELGISNCNVEDISALRKINLTDLTVTGTKIQLIPDLSNSIERLQADNNQIDNISSLKSLNNLRTLRLNNNKINNLMSLRELNKLEILELENNCVQDMEPISNLPALKNLNLCGNPIEDFSCMKLPGLRTVTLSGGIKGEDLDFLGISHGLNSLKITDTDLSKIRKPIPELALERVTMNRCQLKSMDIFINMSYLKLLDVSDNEIDDITALDKIKRVSHLCLKGNRITVDDIPEKWRETIVIDIVEEAHESAMQSDLFD